MALAVGVIVVLNLLDIRHRRELIIVAITLLQLVLEIGGRQSPQSEASRRRTYALARYYDVIIIYSMRPRHRSQLSRELDRQRPAKR